MGERGCVHFSCNVFKQHPGLKGKISQDTACLIIRKRVGKIKGCHKDTTLFTKDMWSLLVGAECNSNGWEGRESEEGTEEGEDGETAEEGRNSKSEDSENKVENRLEPRWGRQQQCTARQDDHQHDDEDSHRYHQYQNTNSKIQIRATWTGEY